MRRQPDARVFMSESTTEIGDALLHNSVNVMTRQREELGVMMYPLYTHRGLEQIADQWQPCRLNQRFTLQGERVEPCAKQTGSRSSCSMRAMFSVRAAFCFTPRAGKFSTAVMFVSMI